MTARRFILTAITLASSSAVIYTIYLHRSLSHLVKHKGGNGFVNSDDENRLIIESLPPELADPSNFVVINDVASKLIPSAKLPKYDEPNLMLTNYLRWTMSRFSRFPQAWMLRMVFKSPEAKKTFGASFIQTLDFSPGDIVCGAYHVQVRSPTKVEFGMISAAGLPPIDGRLVVSIQEQGDHTLFMTETLQWRRREESFQLPLERKSMKWLHELASWWLLEAGTRWLCESKGKL